LLDSLLQENLLIIAFQCLIRRQRPFLSRLFVSFNMDRKAPKSEGNFNHDFCDALIELANWEKNVNRNQHKHNAYRKAAQALSNLDHRISSGNEAKKLPGVGEKIAKKIDEIIETGNLKKLDTIRSDDKTVVINELTRVSGIGPAKAKELYDSGIKTLLQLKENTDKLSKGQIIGLNYVNEFEQRIPRDEIKLIQSKIRKRIRKLDPKYVVTVCGSFRREAETSGDIDVLLTHPDYVKHEDKADGENEDHQSHGHYLHDVVQELSSANLITDTISFGDTKFMGVCIQSVDSTPRRLDIRLVPYNQYYCGILYFTGSDMFNKEMRAVALEKGFTLNEYSLRPLVDGKPDKPLPVSSEKDVFDYLELPYKLPKERTG